jgi:hypothetical protein
VAGLTGRLFVMRRLLWIALFLVGCLSTRTPALQAKATAPDFSLSSHTGDKVSLADMLARGPAVVVFYRGFW